MSALLIRTLTLVVLALLLFGVEIWRLQRRQSGAVAGPAANRADRVLYPAVAGLVVCMLTLPFATAVPFWIGTALIIVFNAAFLIVETRIPPHPDRRPISYRPLIAINRGTEHPRAPRWVYLVLAVGVAFAVASLVIQFTVEESKLPSGICLWAALICIAICLIRTWRTIGQHDH